MAGLFASDNCGYLKGLYAMNRCGKGESWSVCCLEKSNYGLRVFEIVRGSGKDEFNPSELSAADYYVGHIRPVYSEPDGMFHPAKYKGCRLWHTGCLRKDYMSNYDENWDTFLIVKKLVSEGYESLNCIGGTFACIFLQNGSLSFFRNDGMPLYFKRKGRALSAVNFSGGHLVKSGLIKTFVDEDVEVNSETFDGGVYYED